ncbi:MAG: metal ABC transporter substrate-binding protein [Bacillota bacterium]
MRNRVKKLLAAAIAFLLLTVGCARAVNPGNGKNPVPGDRKVLNIVTSFYPVYIAVINVTRDVPGVEVTNMTGPQEGCLHDYALKPEDLKIIGEADVLVINGAGMEAFLDGVIKQQKNIRVIEASEGIPLLKDENGEENPHVWVSVTNMIDYVGNIARRLSEADPENADLYRENARVYKAKLEKLREEMHKTLGNLRSRDIVTFHEAFPYFAKEFDLNVVAVVESGHDSEPTPRELAELIENIRKSGVKALFTEPQYSSGVVETIARETGAKVYTLDPVVSGEASPEAYDEYIEVMRRNMLTLLEALG